MRLNRLLPSLSLVGALLLALPAEAARLQFWRFDPEENRLVFTTDDSIQPTAQLLSNPTRLVIDMPGTTLPRAESQSIDGAIKTISVSELDEETTRLIVEYQTGYTVDPSQVQVRGESARQWTVQLPEAAHDDVTSTTAATENSRRSVARRNRRNSQRNVVSNRPVQGARTRVQGIMATADGFFIRTGGEPAEVSVDRYETDGQRYITLELEQASVALGLTTSRLPVNRYSIDTWRVNQTSVSPARAEITLALGEESPDWEVSVNDSGIVILPKDISISQVPDEGEDPANNRVASNSRLSPATRQQPTDELPTLPNGRFTVVLDPGHGGRDPGAVGINGLQEKQVVNDITPQVAAILRAQGVNVVLTRDRDMEVDLAPRVQIAERANASIFANRCPAADE
ncbi:MAG: N-acetylmuramoyl-L-alanine amidase [Cyanobacteria bacterium J06632_3]